MSRDALSSRDLLLREFRHWKKRRALFRPQTGQFQIVSSGELLGNRVPNGYFLKDKEIFLLFIRVDGELRFPIRHFPKNDWIIVDLPLDLTRTEYETGGNLSRLHFFTRDSVYSDGWTKVYTWGHYHKQRSRLASMFPFDMWAEPDFDFALFVHVRVMNLNDLRGGTPPP
ncbi:MAG: hypothetical protein IPK83_16820 [Planctomycetes bacterium]|nr:hypothetical protein [Planctomycetota bacterium]